MGIDTGYNGQWQYHADRLNREFGGKNIMYCGTLSGGQFAVIPGALKACGHATHIKGPPTICEYRGPNVSPEEFLTGLADIIRANQKEDGPCVGCHYLVPTPMPERFVASCFSSISLHDFCGCNSHCVYCQGSEYFLPVEYVASQDHEVLFRNLLDSGLIRPQVTNVAWGGGEPTLLGTFDQTVSFLRSNRISETINTSGIRFSPQVERALKDRLAMVQISVDSGTNKTYARVKGNSHCDDVWESIERYAATRGNLVVKYIIFSMNSDTQEIESFVERCQSAGVSRICISADVRSVYSHGVADRLTEKEFKAAAAMYNFARSRHIDPYFQPIWLPEHLEHIGQLGDFNANPGQNLEVPVPNLEVPVPNLAVRVARKLGQVIQRFV